MSDAAPDDKYVSDIDPAFSQAWNDVFAPEDEEEAGASGEAAGAAEAGDQAPASAHEGAGGDRTPADAPTAGTLAGVPSGTPAATGTAASSGAAASAPEASLSYADVQPSFGVASEAITARMEESFRISSRQELEAEVDPKYFEALAKHPMALVGEEVPSVKGDGKTIVLRDTAEARDWQDATKGLIEAEIAAGIRRKTDEVKPMMSVIQDSILMLQNNSDLIPGTKEYDPELATQFTDVAKAYELRVGDKLYGYQVNVQPLINSLRERLATQRGASGEQTAQARREAQQRQAQEQARNPQGQFDSPQAGLSSKANVSGDSAGDDFSGFWSGVGMPNLSI